MFRSLIPWSETLPTRGRFPRSISRMEEEMGHLMERLFNGGEGWLSAEGFDPRADLVETDNGFEVKVDLPGLKPEEVHVELKNGDLWITGERKEEKEEKGKTFHRVERRHGEFRRILSLPQAIDETKIEANFHDGVLTVEVPKSAEAKPKQIEVQQA